MSTVTAPAPLDLSGTPRIGFGRLLLVELRKLVDTRASRWLLISIAAVTALIVLIFFLASHQRDRTFSNFTGATGALQSFLLPVLPIMLVTGEWSQRTALTTFTLPPAVLIPRPSIWTWPPMIDTHLPSANTRSGPA